MRFPALSEPLHHWLAASRIAPRRPQSTSTHPHLLCAHRIVTSCCNPWVQCGGDPVLRRGLRCAFERSDSSLPPMFVVSACLCLSHAHSREWCYRSHMRGVNGRAGMLLAGFLGYDALLALGRWATEGKPGQGSKGRWAAASLLEATVWWRPTGILQPVLSARLLAAAAGVAAALAPLLAIHCHGHRRYCQGRAGGAAFCGWFGGSGLASPGGPMGAALPDWCDGWPGSHYG